MQTLYISFRDKGVGGPQGEGEFGYGNGWMSTGDFSMVTVVTIGHFDLNIGKTRRAHNIFCG